MGVPIIRTIVFGGLYWGPLVLGNYHIELGGLGLGLMNIAKPECYLQYK